MAPGSQAEFITEHYWGHSVQRDGGACEYPVDHPPWRVAPASHVELDCDVNRAYGEDLGQFWYPAEFVLTLEDMGVREYNVLTEDG